MNTPLIFCDITDCKHNKYNREYNVNFCNRQCITISEDGICENVEREGGNKNETRL